VNRSKEGNLIFAVGNEEVMRFEPGGKVVIRGEQVDDNREVYAALRRWMSAIDPAFGNSSSQGPQ
jgi:hypothetical protein